MATLTQLPSGKWRAQVRKAGLYRAATFTNKSEATKWARQVEVQIEHISASGFQPIPKGYTVGDLIDGYNADVAEQGRTKVATLKMLIRELGKIQLKDLNSIHLRDFVDNRLKDGAGGVTLAGDLSFFTAVLKWGRHARKMDIPDSLAKDARSNLSQRNINTRSIERDREPTPEELAKLYKFWDNNKLLKTPMTLICKFALATAMRQEEICKLQIEDVDAKLKTVIIRDRKDPRKKIGNNQTVPILPDAWALIEPILQDRHEGYIFPYKADTVSTSFTRACTKLGIIDLHFHDLRHKATSDLFRMGLTIPLVALLTGHKTWVQLKRYTDLKAEDVHKKLEELARLTNQP
nr:site-specific integrase [uncultured Undibacterium sp.]